ncbi:hypothetical protein D4764_01G0021000 [Takifugu flavidus]|uniref:Uncharacterized protein n=1 Tax=Takifugu flavidus TaxID=433684 RepID=A0A5C6PS09_9TELE|nr:hypothetical protein D4764_01G0021000 [Takifugu flavidus]
MVRSGRGMLRLIGTACLWLPLLAEVVADDSYLNQVQDSGKTEAALSSPHRPFVTTSSSSSSSSSSPPPPPPVFIAAGVFPTPAGEEAAMGVGPPPPPPPPLLLR